MSSSLSGLFKTLTWDEFTRKHAKSKDKDNRAAWTHTTPGYGGLSIKKIGTSNPAVFQLADSITAYVKFEPDSWVQDWLFKESKSFQDEMLVHEQGHYNISALVARDFFVDAMLLKSKSFPNKPAAQKAFREIVTGSLKKLFAIHKLYDDDVHPEQEKNNLRGPNQLAWEKFIETAFKTSRSAKTVSSDGVVHKLRLIDVLNSNGKPV